MPEWLVTLIASLKPSAITCCGIALVCSLLLFMPQGFIVFLGLHEFIKEHRAWIGIAWLISTCFCAVYFYKVITPIVTEIVNGYRSERRCTKIIRNLTRNQKALLISFREVGWNEQRLDRHSALVDELFHLRVLEIPKGQMTNAMHQTCFCYVSYWAREYFEKNPEYLLLPPEDI